MKLATIALWNRAGDLRRIDLEAGLNVVTGESQTGKSALIEIVQFCLGASEIRVPAGPIASTVGYYGLLVDVGGTRVFLGRPALAEGQQSSTEIQLEIGVDDVPAFDQLRPTTTTGAARDWLGRAVGIEENRFDPPAGATRPPLVARFSHALIHCFQRQDEIASRQLLFHRQADSFVAQAIRDTLPYFLGVTGPDQLRLSAQLRELRAKLTATQRERRAAEEQMESGLAEAVSLLSQAAEAGLIEMPEPPTTMAGAVGLLTELRDAPPPRSPKQVPGQEFDRLQQERSRLAQRLRSLREQRALALAIAQGGEAAEAEGIEQVVRLQPIGLLPDASERERCPICQQDLKEGPPAVDQLREALEEMERQIGAVERDQPELIKVREDLLGLEAQVREELEANRSALERLSQNVEAVRAHQQQLELGTWVRGRIDHYLERAAVTSEPELARYDASEKELRQQIATLEEELDPDRVKSAATSVLVNIGHRMTEMAISLGLEHADAGVRVDLGRLTVVADRPGDPIYMDTGIGSAKNWVGYHLATVLGLQEYFTHHDRPLPRLLVLDQPTQAFFPSDRPSEEVTDQDRKDALAQFELMHEVVRGLGGALQVLVLDHADFDEDWFRAAVRERWRDGRALIPNQWIAP